MAEWKKEARRLAKDFYIPKGTKTRIKRRFYLFKKEFTKYQIYGIIFEILMEGNDAKF